MAPPKPSGSGLPAGHPSLPPNPFGHQPQQAPLSQQPLPQPQMMQYLQMQMAMGQQLMQSQGYGYGAYFNPQMMMRQSLFQPVSYQPTQNEQGYTYSSSYLEQQQQQQQNPQNKIAPTSASSALPPTAGPSQSDLAVRPAKKPRLQNAPSNPNTATGGAWRNCVQEGCSFVGPEKDVALHEQDRHLIYKKRPVERSEEEEAALKKSGPAPPIPGTAIRLETEEDIAKWIAQRRARWPTAARVEEREKERQEKIARGEIDPNASGRGRRGRGGRTGTRGGRGRGGSEAAGSARARDAGYQQRSQQPAKDTTLKQTKPEEASTLNQTKQEDTSSESDTDDSSDSDTDGDDGVKRDPGPGPGPTETHDSKAAQSPPTGKPQRGICRFFAKTGRCRNGDRCHYLHERQRPDSKPARAQPSSAFTLTTSANRPSLLAALLENPINQTLSNVSQALQFLVDNEFLDGVELNPGEYEEALTHDSAGTRKLVQILETDQNPSGDGVTEVVQVGGVSTNGAMAEETRDAEAKEGRDACDADAQSVEMEVAVVPP